MIELPKEDHVILPMTAREQVEVLPTWDYMNNFRRYVLFARELDAYICHRLTERIRQLDLGPYLPWYTHGGVVLIPKRSDLEKLYVLPQEQILFVKTARDPEHDAAMVRVLRAINAELRLIEHERGVKEHTLGKIMCDDCGAHVQHRSRRMITNYWPVADGSACAPWKGTQYNQTYGGKYE